MSMNITQYNELVENFNNLQQAKTNGTYTGNELREIYLILEQQSGNVRSNWFGRRVINCSGASTREGENISGSISLISILERIKAFTENRYHINNIEATAYEKEQIKDLT